MTLWLWLVGCGAPADTPPAEPPPIAASPAPAAVPTFVHVDRKARTLTVGEPDGTVHTEPIGIGRGGLIDKTAMADEATPTGTFTVDLVLHADGTHNQVADATAAAFADDPEYHRLLASPEGLAALFAAMNGLDFDGDGAPDRAYGDAYIGLHADDAVTGPKMHRYKGTARWFSIALHGTPDPANLGQANSGGCVHLSPSLLHHLIVDERLGIGSVVTIADGPRPE